MENNLVGCIPVQIRRGIEEKGIDYNIAVAGEGFSGKSSLIRNVFGLDINKTEKDQSFFNEVCDIVCTSNPLADLLGASSTSSRSNLSITAARSTLVEESTRINLTVYEISGIGDSVDPENDWIPVRNLISNRYEEYHMEEDKGSNATDRRIHCCLYVLSPRRKPRQIDVKAMKEIGKITNLIPVVSKADSLTGEEYKEVKETLFAALTQEEVQLFDSILVDEFRKVVELSFLPLRHSTPGRVYPHSLPAQPVLSPDITSLRDLLIRSHAIDLVEVMEKYYEKYRKNKLVVEILTQPNPVLDEDFTRKIRLEEAKINLLFTRVEEKRKAYLSLVAQQKKLIPEELA